MADLAFAAGRPYAIVTTVVHRGPGQCKLAELDLHLSSGDVRLRFHDLASLGRFCFALGELAREAFARDIADYHAVRSRVFTDENETPATTDKSLLIDPRLGFPF